MWAGRRVLPTKSGLLGASCGMLYRLTSHVVHKGVWLWYSVCVFVCVCMYKMDMTQQYELEGWFRLVYRANRTIMDIRGLSLPDICIWVFWNLTLLQKDASAPPVIYRSIKPILYYNLIHLLLVQTKAMSVLCNFSKPFLSYVVTLVCFQQ